MVTRFRRYWKIADILFKYQLRSFVQELFSVTCRFTRCSECDSESVTSVYQRLRMAIEELGLTSVKPGQILSTGGDVLPPELFEVV